MNRDVCGQCDAPTELCQCVEPVPFLRICEAFWARLCERTGVDTRAGRDVLKWLVTARENERMTKHAIGALDRTDDSIRREVSAFIVAGLAVRKSNQRDRRRVTIWPTTRLTKIVSPVWRKTA